MSSLIISDVHNLEYEYNLELKEYYDNFYISKNLLIQSREKMKLIVEDTIKEQERILNKEIEKYKDLMCDMTYYMKDKQFKALHANTFKDIEDEITVKIHNKIVEDPRFESSIQSSFKKIMEKGINISQCFESYIQKEEKKIEDEIKVLKSNIKRGYKNSMMKIQEIRENGLDVIIVEQHCKHNDLWNLLYELESSKIPEENSKTGFKTFDDNVGKVMNKIDTISSELKTTNCINKIVNRKKSTSIVKKDMSVNRDIIYLDKIIKENKQTISSYTGVVERLLSQTEDIKKRIESIEHTGVRDLKIINRCRKEIYEMKSRASELERIEGLEDDFKTFIRYMTKETDIFTYQIKTIKDKLGIDRYIPENDEHGELMFLYNKYGCDYDKGSSLDLSDSDTEGDDCVFLDSDSD